MLGQKLLDFHDEEREFTHFGTMFSKEFYLHEKHSVEYQLTIDKSLEPDENMDLSPEVQLELIDSNSPLH
jgi:hypothetical protein